MPSSKDEGRASKLRAALREDSLDRKRGKDKGPEIPHDLIEHIARAMSVADESSRGGWAHYTQMARAAIEAMPR